MSPWPFPTVAVALLAILPGQLAAAAAATPSVILSAVSCADTTHCVAVGQAVSGTDPGSDYAQVWNGKTWRATTVPTPGEPAGLNGVACAGPASCVAVGGYASAAGPGRLLAVAWNGKAWHALAQPPGPADSELTGISCAAPKSCVAVGDSPVAGTMKTLAEAWNGKAWRVLPAANTQSAYSLLDSVSCTGPASCMAVGSSFTSTDVTVTLAERWNGSRWTIESTPSPGSNLNVLASVSCPRVAAGRTATCVAAGYWLNRGAAFAQPLADRWTGTRWQPLKPAVPAGDRLASLLALSCATAASCMSVGGQLASQPLAPLSEAWNGTAWRVRPTASLGKAGGNLLALSCPRPSTCVAVGDVFGATGPARALAEAWNGTRWRVI